VGECRFCHKSCGWLRTEHEECARRHRTAIRSVEAMFTGFLESGASPETLQQSALATASAGHVRERELREIVIAGIEEMTSMAVAAHYATAADAEKIEQAAEVFELTLSECGAAKSTLDKSTILRALDTGHLPRVKVIGDNPVHLQKDETVIWVFTPASCFEIKKHVSYVGGSHGVSLRVARGVYYHTSSHRGRRMEHEHLTLIAKGDLAICSKNVYFLSVNKATRIPLGKIISVNVLVDGIEIFKDSASGKPIIFTIEDPHFAANILSRLA
jgi:hypothetical protein